MLSLAISKNISRKNIALDPDFSMYDLCFQREVVKYKFNPRKN